MVKSDCFCSNFCLRSLGSGFLTVTRTHLYKISAVTGQEIEPSFLFSSPLGIQTNEKKKYIHMDITPDDLSAHLGRVLQHAVSRHALLARLPTFPKLIPAEAEALDRELLEEVLPEQGVGINKAVEEVFERVLPRLSNQLGPRWFGLVTGGVTPASLIGDWLTPLYDQNVILHLPHESLATTLEQHSLDLLLDLFQLPRAVFRGKSLTTGATASNVLALAAARQCLGVMRWGIDIAEDGFSGREIVVLGVKVHASIVKAASLVGIGRKNCIELAKENGDELGWDLERLEALLKEYLYQDTKAVVVVVGFGEVNTGAFATDVPRIRALCTKYLAWLHIDGAFGIFARCSPQYAHLAQHLELANSITADAHKWLNVPYDCGIFFTRYFNFPLQVFGGVQAAYLAENPSFPGDGIPHPMNTGIENSRRLRALPIYLTLRAYGREGYARLVERNCEFAAQLHAWIERSPWYEAVAPCPINIVLFRGVGKRWEGPEGNQRLVEALNATGLCYFTKTVWGGKGAIRAAVSNWRTEVDRDLEIVCGKLEEVGNEEQEDTAE